MQIISIREMKEAEARAMASGTAEFELMRRAGIGAAMELERYFGNARRFVFLVGRGNNGGDALVAAAFLLRRHEVVLYAISPLAEFRNAARTAAENLSEEADYQVKDTLSQWDFRPGDVIVDGLLGTGFTGMLRENYAGFIAAANASRCPIAALDVPSGIDAETGECPSGLAIRAELTITFGYPKKGLFHLAGPEHCGRLRVADIGVPEIGGEHEDAFFAQDAVKILPRRKFDDFKNRSGRIGIFSGSTRYPGAAALNAVSAMRTGGGMVKLFSPVRPHRLPHALIFRLLPADENGFFDGSAAEVIREESVGCDAFCAGSGWGVFPAAPEILKSLLENNKPMVLDADGINSLCRTPELWNGKSDCVLTPHYGEALRLAGAFGVAVPETLTELALALAEKLHCIVLLKGPARGAAHTVTASFNGTYSINSSGSPALAVAGSGDVLCGVIAALLGRGLEAFPAASLGAFLHGRSGENAGETLIADDLPLRVASCIRDLQENR